MYPEVWILGLCLVYGLGVLTGYALEDAESGGCVCFMLWCVVWIALICICIGLGRGWTPAGWWL